MYAATCLKTCQKVLCLTMFLCRIVFIYVAAERTECYVQSLLITLVIIIVIISRSTFDHVSDNAFIISRRKAKNWRYGTHIRLS